MRYITKKGKKIKTTYQKYCQEASKVDTLKATKRLPSSSN